MSSWTKVHRTKKLTRAKLRALRAVDQFRGSLGSDDGVGNRTSWSLDWWTDFVSYDVYEVLVGRGYLLSSSLTVPGAQMVSS